MKKLIVFYFLLILIPYVFAGEESFINIISVKTIYTNTSNSSIEASVNITTEQDTHVFNCISNSTNSWNFNLRRNVSTTADVTKDLANLSGTMSSLTSTCDTIAKQYGDINRYFSLYNQCNVDYEGCKKERTDKQTKIDELSPFKPNYEKCSKDLSDTQTNLNKYSNEIIPSYQLNLTSLTARTDTAEKSKWLYFIFGIVAASAIAIIIERKKIHTTQREKTVGLSR